FNYIIFGRYCGECGYSCATMYKIDALNNVLKADYSDNFWKNGYKPLSFDTEITDKRKLLIAKQIMDHVPSTLLTTTEKKFGCPDCTDGCGIYLQLADGNSFLIDYNTYELTGDIKEFVEFFHKKIEGLEH